MLAGSMSELVDQVREQIRDFKAANKLVKVIGLLAGSAERLAELRKATTSGTICRPPTRRTIQRDVSLHAFVHCFHS